MPKDEPNTPPIRGGELDMNPSRHGEKTVRQHQLDELAERVARCEARQEEMAAQLSRLSVGAVDDTAEE